MKNKTKKLYIGVMICILLLVAQIFVLFIKSDSYKQNIKKDENIINVDNNFSVMEIRSKFMKKDDSYLIRNIEDIKLLEKFLSSDKEVEQYIYDYDNEDIKTENLNISNDKILLDVDISSTSKKLIININNQRQCDETIKFIEKKYIYGDLDITLMSNNIDTKKLVNSIFKRENGNIVITYEKNELDENRLIPNCMQNFTQIINKNNILSEISFNDEEYLYIFRKENIDNLNCYTFEFKNYSYYNSSHSIGVLNGEWLENKELYQIFEVPPAEFLVSGNSSIRWSKEDINFDGYKDLFFYLGYSYGSGGSWQNCRGFIWNKDKNQFEYFPSMPEQISIFEPNNSRIMKASRLGSDTSIVKEYKIVDEKYVVQEE